MKISVIIPSCKPQTYLWECLDSLCAQTLPKEQFEVILVLNGCKEPYNTEINLYVQKHGDTQIVYLQTDQGGVSNARNMGLDVAHGEYVTFVDDDDYISPEYLSSLLEKVTPDTMALCYPHAFLDGDISQIHYRITDAYEQMSEKGRQRLSFKVRRFFNGPCMKLIPMNFIQDRRFDVRFSNGEDALFMFLISDNIKFVDFTSKDAIYYRRYRANSACTSFKSIKYLMNTSILLIGAYSKIYFKHPFNYSLLWYAGRVLATMRWGIAEGKKHLYSNLL